jgi:hypothetical protein
MADEPELVPVYSLHVRCSLKVRCLDQPVYALSDSCGAFADYAVEMASGGRLYRCAEHRNVRWLEEDRRTAQVYPGEDRIGPTYTMVWVTS